MREWKEGRKEGRRVERREEGKIRRKGHSCWKAAGNERHVVDKQCFGNGE